jgi:hypothetical protein
MKTELWSLKRERLEGQTEREGGKRRRNQVAALEFRSLLREAMGRR